MNCRRQLHLVVRRVLGSAAQLGDLPLRRRDHDAPATRPRISLGRAVTEHHDSIRAHRSTVSGVSRADEAVTVLGRAVARGDALPEALHPRVATVAVVLLRNEYVTRGMPTAPDHVTWSRSSTRCYSPLVRGRGIHPSGPDSTARPSFPAQ